MIGVIGRGPWGNVYVRTLTEMGVEHWQAGRNWKEMPTPEAAIVVTAGESHYEVASDLMMRHIPVLIEKPLCMSAEEARHLLELASHTDAIAFCNSRVYSPEWTKFKEQAKEVDINRIYAQAGGPCRLDPVWDWMPHILSMCVDLGARPDCLTVRIFAERVPFRFTVNESMSFQDRMTTPSPIRSVIERFMDAVEKGVPNWRSLAMGVRVVELIDAA